MGFSGRSYSASRPGFLPGRNRVGENEVKRPLLDGKFVDRFGRKFLAGTQHGGRELGMIRRVGIMLGFQAESAIFLIGLATLADDAGIEMNGGIELHAGLGGQHFHLAAGRRIVHFSGETQRSHFSVEDEVVVIAADVLDFANVRADGRGLAKIERSVGDTLDFASGNERGIDRSVIVTVELQDVLKDVAVALTRQVEVTMIGEIQNGGLVRFCRVLDLELIRIGKGVGDVDSQRAGIALFAVGADIGETHGLSLSVLGGRGLPNSAVETNLAAVKRIRSVVDVEMVFLAVESELAIGDAVAVAADGGAEVRVRIAYVAFELIEAKNDVAKFAILVGNEELRDQCAISNDSDRSAVAAVESVGVDDGAVGSLPNSDLEIGAR